MFATEATRTDDHTSRRGTSTPRLQLWNAIFFLGLAGVFLVNAVIAVIHPEDFTDLVRDSALWRWSHLGDPSWLAPVIGINDLVLGLALCAAIRLVRYRHLLLAWTGVWFFAVTLIKLTALD